MVTRKLDIHLDGEEIKLNSTPTYLGLPLDRSLTFKQAMSKLSEKLKSNASPLQETIHFQSLSNCKTHHRRGRHRVLQYGMIIYSSAKFQHKRRLETILDEKHYLFEQVADRRPEQKAGETQRSILN